MNEENLQLARAIVAEEGATSNENNITQQRPKKTVTIVDSIEDKKQKFR